MKAEQISVFLENHAGRLAEVIHCLACAGINIRALSLTDTSDFGILRMILSDHVRAKAILKENGFTHGGATVVAVEVPDNPGGLDSVLRLLAGNGINVEYMYDFVQNEKGRAVVIFRFDRTDEAIELLMSNNFTIIPGDTLASL